MSILAQMTKISLPGEVNLELTIIVGNILGIYEYYADTLSKYRMILIKNLYEKLKSLTISIFTSSFHVLVTIQ